MSGGYSVGEVDKLETDVVKVLEGVYVGVEGEKAIVIDFVETSWLARQRWSWSIRIFSEPGIVPIPQSESYWQLVTIVQPQGSFREFSWYSMMEILWGVNIWILQFICFSIFNVAQMAKLE